jgi:hypothetical protein
VLDAVKARATVTNIDDAVDERCSSRSARVGGRTLEELLGDKGAFDARSMQRSRREWLARASR